MALTLKLCFPTLLLLVALLALHGSSAQARKLHRRKIPALTMYNYLINKGTNSTQGFNSVQCAGPSPPLPNLFGTIFCFDMPLLKKHHVKSELLGRVQGTFTVTRQTGGAIFVTESFILTNATSLPFRGTFSALGMEIIGQNSSKPITGGTDDFQLASGVAFTTPLSSSPTIDAFGNSFFWFKYKFVFEQ